MGRPPVTITLSKKERELLEENVKPRSQYRFVQRARAILLAAEGMPNDKIARKVGLSFVAVSHWRNRYAKKGIVGLKDKEGRGRKRRLTHDQILKIAETACKKPKNRSHWSARRLSDELGFVKKSRLQEILKGFDLKPHQSQMWCFSNDPNYEKKKADVVGLYLNPPKNAFVVCIDEKPGIQILSRRIEPMALGRPERSSHEYKRNGVIDLFAAFRVNDGKAFGMLAPRHTGIEFLLFLKRVYEKWGKNKKTLHIIIDNFGTHDVDEVQEWLSKHRNVHFHFTPTHASWLNQVELWFGIIQRQLISRGSFESKKDLSRKILGFIEEYNKTVKAFMWTYGGEPLKI